MRLRDVCRAIIDCEHKTAPTVDSGDYSVIRTPDIGHGRLKIDTAKKVSKATYEAWTRRAIPEAGDLIFAREAPVGNIAVIQNGEKVCLGQRTVLIRPDVEKVLSDYLCYLLLSAPVRGALLAKAAGSTVPHLNVEELRNFTIPELPTLGVQRQVVFILSAYDELIATNQRRIQLLEEAARRLYREWFVQLRFPGHEQVKVVDGLPEGWEITKAYDVLEIMSGGTPKTEVAHYWAGDIPFFTPKDAPNGFYVLATEKNMTEDGLKSCNSKLYPKETIFITARGTVGKMALAQRPMAMNQSCYALKAKHGSGIDNLFLFMAMLDAVEHFKQAASEGVFRSIVGNTFKIIPFIQPTPDLTAQYGDMVRPMFGQIETLTRQNGQLKQARDGLLPKLMSGELKV